MRKFAGLLVFVLIVSAAYSAEPTLEGLKIIYEKELQRIRSENTPVLNADKQYLKSLEALETEYKKQGDFDGTKAVMDERKRFEVCKMVPPEPGTNAVEGITTAQKKYLKALSRVEEDRDTDAAKLTRQYMEALKEVVKGLMEKNEMNKAGEANNELKRVAVELKKFQAFKTDVTPSGQEERVVTQSEKPVAVSSGKDIAANLKKGLVLYFSFDKDENGVVTDESGNNNNGMVYGATWISKGLAGGAYVFNGVDNYIKVNNSASLAITDFTISVWHWYAFSGGSQNEMIMEKGPHDGCFEIMNWSNGYILLRGGSPAGIHTNSRFSKGVWHNIVSVISSTTGSVYIDGKMVKSGSVTMPVPVTSEVLYIGADYRLGAIQDFLHGNLDEIRIYNRVLSDKEIKQLYNFRK